MNESIELSPEELAARRQLVFDEAARTRIRSIWEDPPQSTLSKISRHPMSSVILGFILTGLIATLFTGYLARLQLNNDRVLEETKARRESGIRAVVEFASLLYQRRVRAELLASSLKRGAGIDELNSRKAAYDAAYVQWNVDLQKNYLTIREIVGQSEYSSLESYVQYGLTPHFNAVDQYVTQGYDAKLAGDKQWTYNSDMVRGHLQAILDCGYVITQDLWLTANFYGKNLNDIAPILQKAAAELRERCPQGG